LAPQKNPSPVCDKPRDPLRAPGRHVGEDPATRASLDAYAEIVRAWAPKTNLVSQVDLPDFVDRHILPALALRPIIQALPHRRLLDVGSGAGLPGIPLAITLPSSRITLIESRRRRANFLRHVVRSLALTNVTVVCERVEAWTATNSFDIVMSRAVTDLASLALMARSCLHSAGFLLVTTGPETGHRNSGMRATLPIVERFPAALTALVAHPIGDPCGLPESCGRSC